MTIPPDGKEAELEIDGKLVRLTNLEKPFWPEFGITKRDLLEYYVEISRFLLPHLADRAMVMKRYPNGAHGEFFFMKRTPSPHPEWLRTCSITHASGNVIAFPVIDDLAALLWVVNLGCIDLNQWYAKCDDVNRPDYLHFDLDPVVNEDGKATGWKQVLETAGAVREALDALEIPSYPKTTGSRGIHVYVPIVRGPLQKQVWTFAKEFAKKLESRHPKLITAEYRVAKRPAGRVLVDYNQNAWGRTLASVYSVRPRPDATVSTPVTWDEVAHGFRISNFTMRNVPQRVNDLGDLYKPLLAAKGRVNLEKFLK
jgi:bifunctional non-homologous end joining protein LigD